MFDRILRLGKETAVYGLSTIAGRLMNFLIVPLYANVLLPSENGVIANLYAYIAFVLVIYNYGMEQAYMRFVSSLELGDKKQNFSVPFFSIAASSVILSLLLHVHASVVGSWIGLVGDQAQLVRYAAWILCFDTLSTVPFALLRMEQRAKRFAAFKIFNIVTNLVLNVVFLVGLGLRAEGVFLSNLIASAATFLGLLFQVRHELTIRFHGGLYRQLLRFGLPYVPAGLAGVALQVIDRPIVKALTNDATLGVYQLNYRLGIFMMLIVGMFDYAWRPFFLNHAKDADAKELFSRVFTYFVLAMLTTFLVISLFIGDLVRMTISGRQFFPPVYWSGISIVPWILLSYVFTGLYVVFVVGVYLEKKTGYLPFVTGAGAIVNVGVNYALIPVMGILGAALATLASYVVMAAGMYLASQKLYRIDYDWGRVLRILIAVVAIFALFQLLNPLPMTSTGLFLKIGLMAAFTASVYFLKIVNPDDAQFIREAIARRRSGATSPNTTPGDVRE